MEKTDRDREKLPGKYRTMDGERLERLLDHMLYGHAMIAYHKQNGDFKFVKGTLIYYEAEFHKAYDPTKVEGAVVYWDVEQQGWRTFLVENFMEWRPIQ